MGQTFHDGKIYSTVIFSSPELKAQVSFSHQNLYVVVNFSYCHLLLQTSEPISIKLGWREFQILLSDEGLHPL